MTDEHVFPQSIGGDSRTVIRVCATCNSTGGHIVDSFVSRHSWLRLLAVSTGKLMNRQEKHPSTAVLKDGRHLTGRIYFVHVGTNEAKIQFDPDSMQPDGSRWISEHACANPAKLPHHINIYRDIMLDKASVNATPPEGAGLEAAMAKFLLGMSYLMRGKDELMLPGFDALRNCLSGTIDPRVSVMWIGSLDEIRGSLPFEFHANEHTVWGKCDDGKTFLGGVSLFGRIIAEIQIKDFGSKLEGRCSGTPNPWLSNHCLPL